MNDTMIRNIVIVGGGTSGWMAAALFARSLGTVNYQITLVESEDIGTVGVGEATIPPIVTYNNALGLDEDAFVRETQATFKLGIEFVNWGAVGSRYIHPFGSFGSDMDGASFHDFWFRYWRAGGNPNFGLFNIETLAGLENRFGRPARGSTLPGVNYAFQFDAGLYAAFLRKYAEARGVVRKEGKIVRVDQTAESGFVEAVVCEDGTRIVGDLFLDCSGFRGLLIEQTLKCGYDDWTKWLPCDRAAAVASERPRLENGLLAPTTPFTRSTAHEAGWQWRVPLQHRVGNGHVFCSHFLSEDEACSQLLSRLDAPALREPKILRFTTGHRRRMWDKNVVALGLSSGFLEPLESTSIHLAQLGASRLLSMMPKRGINPVIVEQYNNSMLFDYNNVKDFLIAHYKVTQREDTPFWRHCRHLPQPDSLQERIELFRAYGRVMPEDNELFPVQSWQYVLTGQGIAPASTDPMAARLDPGHVAEVLDELRAVVGRCADLMPAHGDFLDRNNLKTKLTPMEG